MLTLFNTLTGKKDLFEPLAPPTVRMYVCGVTVYDYCHLGHARSALVFDVARRYLEHAGYTVEFVKNFTDVDDKIIKRANDHGVPWDAVTAKYIHAYYEDMERLGIRRAWREPKATEHIADIIAMVKTLIRNGLAYQIDGDVYYAVQRFPSYGRLSKRRLEDLQAGARVEIDDRKRHPMDFALWKSSKPGEPSWESPWGHGRPGWHIECSAMSIRHLGETFDIHGGGMDLIFPHHENEIAQSCGATGKEFARYWLHNGFVQINKEKMSKSLGNFFTIREIFEKSEWPEAVTGEALRYLLLGTHYRSPLEFSDQGLRESKNALNGFYDLFDRLTEPAQSHAGDEDLQPVIQQAWRDFTLSMDDDLHTPGAIAAMQRLRNDINKLLKAGCLSPEGRREVRKTFRTLGSVLELFQLDQWQFADGTGPASGQPHGHLTDSEIEARIAERAEAKKKKDFNRADQIRAELAASGVLLEDRPDGTSRWKR